jgi:hypothetical protein
VWRQWADFHQVLDVKMPKTRRIKPLSKAISAAPRVFKPNHEANRVEFFFSFSLAAGMPER